MLEHVFVDSALLEEGHSFELFGLEFDGVFGGGVEGVGGLVDGAERALVNEFADAVLIVFSDERERR